MITSKEGRDLKKLHELVARLNDLARDKGRTPTSREFVSSGVSRRQITNHGGYNAIVRAAGLEPNKVVQAPNSTELIELRFPKILIFDIETSYMLVKVYQLKTDYISHKKIVQDWHFLSYAGKFLGEETIHYLDQRYAEDVKDDRQLIEGLHHLISQADVLVGHNLDQFDIKMFNSRAALYDLEPLHDLKTWDTMKLVKSKFRLPSFSLDYCARFFKLENQKSGHSKFPGDQLWDECIAGNVEAWDECSHYNRQDCIVTEELFLKMAKFCKQVNVQAYMQKRVCVCGSEEFYKDGFETNKQSTHQRYRCRSCLKPFVAKENLIDKDIKKAFFK